MDRKEKSGKRRDAGRLTFFSYLCALAVAVFLILPLAAEPLYKSGGVKRVRVPYLALELPMESGRAAEGPLAEGTGDPGQPHRAVMRRKGMDAPGYLAWVRKWPWEGKHYTCKVQETRYEVYYVRCTPGITRIPIPAGYEYTITGDGGNGFVVAVHQRDTIEGGNIS